MPEPSVASADSTSVPLTPAQRAAMRVLVGLMIPASTELAVPGADDDAIFADIVANLGRDTARVVQALERLDQLAGGAFADQAPARQAALADTFRQEPSGLPLVLVNVTVRCYYRDDRVMRSIGMELRPPFPKGFELEEGDWSLLDPVRSRPPIYRKVP